jgi:spore photoproduct lyase
MSSNQDITWVIEPHTEAKHEILRRYLGAWFPILAKRQNRLLYVDGFAGPGEYKGEEDGSPIIALNVASTHFLTSNLLRLGMELVFIFIEKDRGRCENLKHKIAELQVPGNFKIHVECDSFENTFGKILSQIEEQSARLAPSFVFIDPFGPTGFRMSLIARLAQQRRSEVLITFNYQALNQWFLQDRAKHKHLDELYGNETWRPALNIANPREKERFLREAYHAALETFGWKVRPFRMINRHNQTQYYLFFATGHWRGMLAMKEAMWKAAQKGDFQYSDLTDTRQASLFEQLYEEEYSQELANQLYKSHHGETILKLALLQQDLAWHPVCVKPHLTKALNILEYKCDPPKIIKVETLGRSRRARTYPEDCTITFAGKSEERLNEKTTKLKVAIEGYQLLDGTEVPLVRQIGDGSIIRRFDKTPMPTQDTSVVCPHFLELKWAYGCPFDCAWCYLKGTFRFRPTRAKPVIKDRNKTESHTRTFLEEVTTPEVLNTGEIADSLMGEGLDPPFSKLIIPMFEEQDRHKVLFVTKSDNIKHLLEADTHSQVIISFSLNADVVAERWENGAPSVSRRLEAGRKLDEIGYEIRVRIDPMVPVPDWERQYMNLIDQILANFRPCRITLGSLRGLQSTVNGSTDRSWVEYLKESSNWGKKVDFKTRYGMYATVINQLKEKYDYNEIALCKETVAMWGGLGMDYREIRCNCIW